MIDWLRNAAGLFDSNYWRGTLRPQPVLDWYLKRIDEAVSEAKELTLARERIWPGEMGGKQKIGQAIGKNRHVLGDIGNLVTAPAVDGKPKPQITNAQEKKNKKQLAEVVKKVPVKKKASDNETVIVISPGEVKAIEKSPLSRRKTKKSGKTLTSTLTAKSKAACGLFNRPKNEIDDINAADADNHLAVVEYVEDIYNFYKLTEDEGRVNDYMDFQPELNHKMRAILWTG